MDLVPLSTVNGMLICTEMLCLLTLDHVHHSILDSLNDILKSRSRKTYKCSDTESSLKQPEQPGDTIGP